MADHNGRRDDLRERAQRALHSSNSLRVIVKLAARYREQLDPPEPQVPR